MIQAAHFRVKVRIASIEGARIHPLWGSVESELIKGRGEEWITYGPNGLFRTKDLRRAIEVALRIPSGSFEILVEHDDGSILSGAVVDRDSDLRIGLWGTCAPHRRRFDKKGRPT